RLKEVEGGLLAERGLSRIGRLPNGCTTDGLTKLLPHFGSSFPFAVAGKVGKGRLVVLADHSVFIDIMLATKENGNAAFAENCVGWLAEGRQPRDRVLFYEEGTIRTKFDVLPVRDVPIDLPPPEKLVPLMDRFLADAERSDTFDRILRDLV